MDALDVPSEQRARSLLAFLNTRPCPACRAGEALRPGRVPGSAGDDLRQLRGDLIALLDARIDGTRPAPELLRRVNRRLRRGARVLQIAWDDGKIDLRFHPLRSGIPPDDGPGPAADWIPLVADPRLPIDRCAAEGCRHFLLRRRSNQRWCSPEGCGNRARVARHYRKRRRS
ncbi:MAG: CGNR zinc finger domain-containing protein [Thermoplasmata archaeon]